MNVIDKILGEPLEFHEWNFEGGTRIRKYTYQGTSTSFYNASIHDGYEGWWDIKKPDGSDIFETFEEALTLLAWEVLKDDCGAKQEDWDRFLEGDIDHLLYL